MTNYEKKSLLLSVIENTDWTVCIPAKDKDEYAAMQNSIDESRIVIAI